MIDKFENQFEFLSNFFPCFERNKTVEHFYQAAKTDDPIERHKVIDTATPAGAKKAGRKVTIRPDWDSIKLSVMEELLRTKFNDPHLRQALVSTGSEELVEGNWWGDTYWGVCKGVGENHLGKLLMKLRAEYAS